MVTIKKQLVLSFTRPCPDVSKESWVPGCTLCDLQLFSPSFFRRDIRDMIQDMISVMDPKKAHNIYHVQCSFTK